MAKNNLGHQDSSYKEIHVVLKVKNGFTYMQRSLSILESKKISLNAMLWVVKDLISIPGITKVLALWGGMMEPPAFLSQRKMAADCASYSYQDEKTHQRRFFFHGEPH